MDTILVLLFVYSQLYNICEVLMQDRIMGLQRPRCQSFFFPSMSTAFSQLDCLKLIHMVHLYIFMFYISYFI